MNDQIRDYLKTIGKRGGDKTKAKGTAHYRAIGRRGALKRWSQNQTVCDSLVKEVKTP